MNDDTHGMVKKVMQAYNLEWRDRGTKTTKTFLDKIAKYAIGKVRKNLMPKILKRVTNKLQAEAMKDLDLAEKIKEYKNSKRTRGGIKEKKFVAEFFVKKETEVMSSSPMQIDCHNDRGEESVSTITGGSQLVSQCIQDGVSSHFDMGGGEIRITSIEEWEDFKRQYGNVGKRRVVNSEEGREEENGEEETEEQEVCEYYSEEESERVNKCDGDCDLRMETETHRPTLRKRFGSGMKCGGKDCGIALWKATKEYQLAYACNNCKQRECGYMLCGLCYQKQAGTRKARGGGGR